MRERIDAVSVDELLPINVDVSRAVSTALGAAERIDTLRSEYDPLTGFDRFAVQNLRALSLAALYAHVVVRQREEDDQEDIEVLDRQSTELRDDLRVAAEALAHRELLSPERVAGIRRGRGRVQVASELVALRGVLREAWPRIEAATSISLEEIEQAGALGARLHAVAGSRDLGPDPRMGPADVRTIRDKAFTLFMRAYDECRRVVLYLRWHEGDADAYAPSLYRRRGRRRGGSLPTGPTSEFPPGADLPPLTVVPADAEDVA